MKEMLKGNLHTHTTLSDGSLSPKDVVYLYKEKDYDFIALTDHVYSDTPKVYSYPNIEEIIVLEGCEVSSGHHWCYIKGDKESLTIWCHPERYGDTIQEINRCNKDLCEITEHGDFYINITPNSCEILERCRIGVIVTDDSHSERMIGRTAVYVRADYNKDSIIWNLKKGNYAIWTRDMVI